MRFDYAVLSLLGQRTEQEDAIALQVDTGDAMYDQGLQGDANALVIAVADGMGGHAAGAAASKGACACFMAAIRSSEGDVVARMVEALGQANTAIGNAIKADPKLKTMGCTLAAISLAKNALEWVSAGDTHVFLLRDKELMLLNADQSWKPALEKLAAAGKMSVEEARNAKENNSVYSALTGEDIGPIDRSHHPFMLASGDVVIAVTDGIDTLSHKEILAACLAGPLTNAADIAERLLAAVEAAGDEEQDNTTLCVIRVQNAMALAA